MAKRVSRNSAIESSFVQGSESMVVDPKLTGPEKSHIEQLVIRGGAYLDELGWDETQKGTFFARPNVKRELDRQLAALADGPGLLERHRFMARVRMCSMIPMALQVVTLALRGHLPGPDGTTIPASMIPTSDQYRVAQDILDRCGIAWDTDINVKMLVGAEVNFNANVKSDPGKPDKETDRRERKYDVHAVTQRERVRTSLMKILKTFADTDAELVTVEKKRMNADSPTRGTGETDAPA